MLRVAYCLASGSLGHTGPGYLEYVQVGQRLLEHGTLTSPLITDVVDTRPSALMPPAYAAFVTTVYALLGVNTFAATLALHLVNAAATSLVVLFVFLIIRALATLRAAWLGALIAAINPTLIGFTDYVWDTSLFALGVIVAAWLSIQLSSRPKGAGRWLGFGFYLGALALLNPALTIAYPFLVLWPVVRDRRGGLRPIIRTVLLATCGWAVAITPWTVRNYVQFGDLLYVRSGPMLELWLGVCPEAEEHGSAVYAEQFPLLNEGVQAHISAIGEAAYLDECRTKALEAISGDPWRFARLSGIRAVDYWLGTVFTHTLPGDGGWPKDRLRAGIALFLTLEVLIIAACLLLRPRALGKVWWLVAVVMAFSLVYCLTHIQIRFRAPVEPLMAVIVSILLVEMFGVGCSPQHRLDRSDSSSPVGHNP